MKLEELSGIWNSTDMELEKSIKINKQLVKELGLAKVKSRLYEIKWTSIIEIGVNAIFLSFLTGFIFDHFSDFKFSIPAFILLVVTVVSLIIEIYKLTLFYTLDAKSAVIEAQKKLTRLKKLEILDIYSLYIIIPLFSAPFLIVSAKAFLHLSLYAFDMTWLIYYTIGSVVVAVIIIFFLKRYPDKNLSASIAFLHELKENEN